MDTREQAGGPGADPGFDPAQAQAILDDQPVLAQRLTVDGVVLFTAWGLAWLLGYGLLWWSGRDTADSAAPGWALTIHAALLLSAVVVTAVHIARRSRGVRGRSATAGMLYGWTWGIAFLAVGIVIGGMADRGLTNEQVAVLANGLSCLVVGALYMAGAAMSRDVVWFALGAWIAAVASLATTLPLDALYLVMALAGGGGMLVGAVITSLWRRRRPHSPNAGGAS